MCAWLSILLVKIFGEWTRDRRTPLQGNVIWTCVNGLDYGDVAGGKAGFAVFEVVVPGTDEGGVETERADLIEFGVKGFVPYGKCAGVVES